MQVEFFLMIFFHIMLVAVLAGICLPILIKNLFMSGGKEVSFVTSKSHDLNKKYHDAIDLLESDPFARNAPTMPPSNPYLDDE